MASIWAWNTKVVRDKMVKKLRLNRESAVVCHQTAFIDAYLFRRIGACARCKGLKVRYHLRLEQRCDTDTH